MGNKLHYDAVELIKEYTKQVVVNNNYNLTDEDISLICKYQFIFTRRTIEANMLSKIRIKYLGSFQVFNGRAKGILNKAHRLRDNDQIKQSELETIELMVNNFLKDETDTPALEEMA